MKRRASFVIVVALAVVGLSKTAHAQVETQPDTTPPPPLPAPNAQPASQAAAPPAASTSSSSSSAPMPTPTPNVGEAADAAPKTMTFVLPRHRFEMIGRLGVIGGGVVTPKGLSEGHSTPAPIVGVDLDMITLPFNPFFTLGSYAQFTKTGYERYSGGTKTNTDGGMTLFSFGASAKARLPISQSVVAKAGVYLGYNHLDFSVIETGKTMGASGGGLNVAFTGELVIDVSRTVAINIQASFISQVAGGVTVDGESKDHDLAMTPKPFITAGPEIRF